jgi:hypothetical protein
MLFMFVMAEVLAVDEGKRNGESRCPRKSATAASGPNENGGATGTAGSFSRDPLRTSW